MKETGFSRVSKEAVIKEIEKEVKARPTFFITSQGTLPANVLDKLRANLRKVNARYLVIKNSLGRKAFERAKLADFNSYLEKDTSGIAFVGGDPAVSSKLLMDCAKENEVFKVRVGYLNGQVVSSDKIKALASLPSREVLLSRLFGQMQAPISRFAGVLSNTLRSAVNVLDAIAKKKGEK